MDQLPTSPSAGPLPQQVTIPQQEASLVNEVETSDAWKLFVGQVPRNIRQEDLVAQFAVFGELEEVFIIRDQSTGLSKGCCFVRFTNRASAELCIETLNDKVTLQGASNPLQVSFAAPHSVPGNRATNSPNEFETKLFVGQIPTTFTEVELSSLFEPYGIIKEVFIMRHRDTGLPKGAGFVRLEADPANVKRAIADLNGKQLEGSPVPMKVDVAHQKAAMLSPRAAMAQSMISVMGHRGYPMQAQVMAYSQAHAAAGWYAAQPQAMDRKSTSNLPKLFVGGLTPHTTEQQLFELFSHYGQVREVVILRLPNGQSKSSGFVKYSTEEEADVAVASLSSRYYLPQSNRPLTVRYAGPANNPPEHKLFVGHLPAHYEEHQTEMFFRQFGEVVEVHVMRDQRGQTKGSAFVKFADRMHAESAIQALHGSTSLGGDKPLKVSFAHSRSSPGMSPHTMMGQPPMIQVQQLSPTSMGHMNQAQHSVRGGMNGNGAVVSPSQSTASEHMQMQQQYGAAYAYYPHMATPYFSLSAAAVDGSNQLPVTF